MCRHCWYCPKLMWFCMIFVEFVLLWQAKVCQCNENTKAHTNAACSLHSKRGNNFFKYEWKISSKKRGQPRHVLHWCHQCIFLFRYIYILMKEAVTAKLNLWQYIFFNLLSIFSSRIFCHLSSFNTLTFIQIKGSSEWKSCLKCFIFDGSLCTHGY